MQDLETKIERALVHLEYLREDVSETKSLVKAQNGRVRDLENQVTEIKVEAKAAGSKWGAIVGGLITGAGMVWQALKGSGQ